MEGMLTPGRWVRPDMVTKRMPARVLLLLAAVTEPDSTQSSVDQKGFPHKQRGLLEAPGDSWSDSREAPARERTRRTRR